MADAEKKSYRILKGEFHQNDPANDGKLKVFGVGDVIELTEEEMAAQGVENFEPIAGAPAPAPIPDRFSDEG